MIRVRSSSVFAMAACAIVSTYCSSMSLTSCSAVPDSNLLYVIVHRWKAVTPQTLNDLEAISGSPAVRHLKNRSGEAYTELSYSWSGAADLRCADVFTFESNSMQLVSAAFVRTFTAREEAIRAAAAISATLLGRDVTNEVNSDALAAADAVFTFSQAPTGEPDKRVALSIEHRNNMFVLRCTVTAP